MLEVLHYVGHVWHQLERRSHFEARRFLTRKMVGLPQFFRGGLLYPGWTLMRMLRLCYGDVRVAKTLAQVVEGT